jgi:anti-sigma28 factor (negative regulator of flagellin synthesis)
MSTRIDPRLDAYNRSQQLNTTRSGRAQQTNAPQQGQAVQTAQPQVPQEAATFEPSPQGLALSQAASTQVQQGQTPERIAELKAKVQANEYRPDPRKTATSMVDVYG